MGRTPLLGQVRSIQLSEHPFRAAVHVVTIAVVDDGVPSAVTTPSLADAAVDQHLGRCPGWLRWLPAVATGGQPASRTLTGWTAQISGQHRWEVD